MVRIVHKVRHRRVLRLVAIKVIARNNVRAPLRILISRTIRGVITALDASSGSPRLNKLDVVLVAETLRALGVALAVVSAGGVVLAAGVVGVETREVGGVYAAGHYGFEEERWVLVMYRRERI